ncbi:MAG: hypothetical protein IT165_19660 [Bryobacterales bacterium]|nr:hypothetical protein [Bryobacterales bacterium]
MLNRVLLCFAVLGSLWLAAAADVNGTWKAEFTSPDGQQRTNTFHFKADGDKLTGTVAGSQDQTPIENGKISGDSISFTAERPFGKFTYSGKVSGNEMKLKVEFGDNAFEITAKRTQ